MSRFILVFLDLWFFVLVFRDAVQVCAQSKSGADLRMAREGQLLKIAFLISEGHPVLASEVKMQTFVPTE